ncbi:hypothetical protein ACP4OV_015850 [Aristida adscensionis]
MASPPTPGEGDDGKNPAPRAGGHGSPKPHHDAALGVAEGFPASWGGAAGSYFRHHGFLEAGHVAGPDSMALWHAGVGCVNQPFVGSAGYSVPLCDAAGYPVALGDAGVGYLIEPFADCPGYSVPLWDTAVGCVTHTFVEAVGYPVAGAVPFVEWSYPVAFWDPAVGGAGSSFLCAAGGVGPAFPGIAGPAILGAAGGGGPPFLGAAGVAVPAFLGAAGGGGPPFLGAAGVTGPAFLGAAGGGPPFLGAAGVTGPAFLGAAGGAGPAFLGAAGVAGPAFLGAAGGAGPPFLGAAGVAGPAFLGAAGGGANPFVIWDAVGSAHPASLAGVASSTRTVTEAPAQRRSWSQGSPQESGMPGPRRRHPPLQNRDSPSDIGGGAVKARVAHEDAHEAEAERGAVAVLARVDAVGYAPGAPVAMAGRVQDHPRAARGAVRAPPARQTPEGKGRRSQRRVAQALVAFRDPTPPEEDPSTHLVRPPEGEGEHQDSPFVVSKNADLTTVYNDMVEIVKSVRLQVKKRKQIQDAVDSAMAWTSIRHRIEELEKLLERLLTDYDQLAEEVDSLRIRIRVAGGHPVEPPDVLSIHPRSLSAKKG